MNLFVEVLAFAVVLIVGIFALIVLIMLMLGAIHTRILIQSVNRHLELNRYRTAEELRAAMVREPYLLFAPSAAQIENLALSVAIRRGNALARPCSHHPGTQEYIRALPPARSRRRRRWL